MNFSSEGNESSAEKNGIKYSKYPPSTLEAVFLKPGYSCWNVFKCSYTYCVLTTWASYANIHLQEIFCFSMRRSHPANMGKLLNLVWSLLWYVTGPRILWSCSFSGDEEWLIVHKNTGESGWKSTSTEDSVFKEARFHSKCKTDGFYYRVSASAVYLRKSSAETIKLIYVIRNTWCLSWWIIIAIPCCKIAHGAVKWSSQCICDERSIISRHLVGI